MEEEFILSQPNLAFKKLSIPLIIFAIFSAFYNLIDIYWANLISHDAIVVIAVVLPLFILINIIGRNIGQGANVVMSHFQGSFNVDETSNAFIHGVLICILISILIPLLVLIFFNPLVNFLQIQSQSQLVYSYLIPLAMFSFIFIFPLFFTETAISEGNANRPIIYLIIQDIVKFISAPILIFSLGLGIVVWFMQQLSLLVFHLYYFCISIKAKLRLNLILIIKFDFKNYL